MLLPEEQVWRRRAHDALEQEGISLKGALGSRSRRGLARGGVQPPSEAKPHPRGRPPSDAEPHPRGRPALERGGTSPEGATGPRARRSCTGTAPYPSSGVEFRPRVARPIALVGRGSVGLFCACFFTNLSGFSVVVLGTFVAVPDSWFLESVLGESSIHLAS
jgi:hypothetical protein